jgi:hypothetical protein
MDQLAENFRRNREREARMLPPEEPRVEITREMMDHGIFQMLRWHPERAGRGEDEIIVNVYRAMYRLRPGASPDERAAAGANPHSVPE